MDLFNSWKDANEERAGAVGVLALTAWIRRNQSMFVGGGSNNQVLVERARKTRVDYA